jgi:hypothetical protein
MKTIEFTPDKLKALKKAYNKARTLGREQFDFEGHPLLVPYAKYLIEYLETYSPIRRRVASTREQNRIMT